MNHAIHSSRPARVARATPEPGDRPRGVSDPTSPVATSRRRREIVKSLSSWAAAIAAAALGFWLTEGTSYHQLAIAFLTVLVTLALALALLEGIWRLLAYAFGSDDAGRRRARPGGD
jgi:hypothetical protein